MATKRTTKRGTRGNASGTSPESAPKPVLTLKVTGPGVRKGRISIPDLLRVCEETQNAITRQAEALQGRKTIHPGPATVGIRSECTLELVSIREGSTMLGFDFAKPQLVLPIPEQRTLGVEAIGEVASTIQSLGNGDKKKDHDPGVLRSIYGMSSLLDNKITSLTWETQTSATMKSIKAKITKVVRERAAAHLSKPSFRPFQVDGVLDMADFNRKDRKCRVDPAIGLPVVCLFGVEFEEKVHAHLRQAVHVQGIAKIQPDSGRIEYLQMTALEPLSSLALGEGNFLQSPTIQELAEAQGVKAFSRAKATEWFSSDEEIEAFVAGIYNARKKA